MWHWTLVALFVVAGHFAASYLVPLDEASQSEFLGLLRWFWPWADGDSGPLGRVTAADGFPVQGFFLAVSTAALFLLAALAVLQVWIPFAWWRALAASGAVLSVALMALFFGPTKLIPIGLDLVVLWVAVTNWSPAAAT